MVYVSNCIATAFSPDTSMARSKPSSLGAALLIFSNIWVLSRSQLHPGCCFQVKVSKATRPESQEINLSFGSFPDWSLDWRGAASPELQIPSFQKDQVTHTTPRDYLTWFFLDELPSTLSTFRSFIPRALLTDNDQNTKFKWQKYFFPMSIFSDNLSYEFISNNFSKALVQKVWNLTGEEPSQDQKW